MSIVHFMHTRLPYRHSIMHIAVSLNAMKSYRFLSPTVSNKRKAVREDRSLLLLTPLWNMLFSQVGPLSPPSFLLPRHQERGKKKENGEYCWPLFAIQNRKPKAKLFLSLTLPILFNRKKRKQKSLTTQKGRALPMTKMTSHRFNINGYHSNGITRRPFLYTHEGRGGRRDQGGWGKEGETIKTGKKVKKNGGFGIGE